jgi:hypothetical protein
MHSCHPLMPAPHALWGTREADAPPTWVVEQPALARRRVRTLLWTSGEVPWQRRRDIMSKLSRTAELAMVAVIALGATAGVAMAGEGNGDPFGLEGSRMAITAEPIQQQTGSAAYPGFDPNVRVGVMVGGVAPANGSQGEPEPLNSLPSAPEVGGVWSAQQQHQLG